MSRSKIHSIRQMDGFTMLEVLVVTTIIAILTAMTWNVVFSARDRAKQSATMADMRNLAMAIEAYSIDHNFPPPTADEFVAVAALLAPYQFNAMIPVRDHWRNAYGYESEQQHYSVTSLGKDGLLGQGLTWETRFDYERDIILVNGEFRYWPADPSGQHDNGHHFGQNHGTGNPNGTP